MKDKRRDELEKWQKKRFNRSMTLVNDMLPSR